MRTRSGLLLALVASVPLLLRLLLLALLLLLLLLLAEHLRSCRLRAACSARSFSPGRLEPLAFERLSRAKPMLPRALDLDRRRLRVAVPMELRRGLDAVAALSDAIAVRLAHDLVSVLLARGTSRGSAGRRSATAQRNGGRTSGRTRLSQPPQPGEPGAALGRRRRRGAIRHPQG